MTSQVGKSSLIDVAVGSVMTKPLKTIEEDEPLSNCVKIMNEANLICYCALNRKACPDLHGEDLIRKMAKDRQYLSMPISEVMRSP